MSMRTLILAVTGFAVSVAACSSYGTGVVEVTKTPARVASVSVTVPSSLAAGQKARCAAITKDANGAVLTGRAITWFTSSGSIASVTDSGVISAVAPGTAVVSAVSEGISGQATMAVLPPPPTPIATVSVAISPSSVVTGQTAHATATLMDSAGNQILGRTVTWQSSNSGVATVTQTGDLTAVGPGTAMISGSSGGLSASSALSVSAPAPIPVASVSVSPSSASLLVGATVQLSAVTRDANNNVLTGRLIGWSSANSAIASVSASGLVTAVAAGSVSVTVSSEGQTASAAIAVSAPAPVPVASVSVSPATSSLLVGATVQLSAVTRDANNNTLTGRVVTWSSANANIASVNSTSGLVTAVAAGSATITATSETQTGTATITVSVPAPAPVATVTVSPASSSLYLGSSVQLSATTRDANNNVLTGRVVTWSSANAGIASVNSTSGLVTTVATGTVQITATSEGQSGSASVTVTVPPPPGSSNEPAGMTFIKERAFNALQEDPSWDTDSFLTIIQDPTAPKSPSNALRFTFPTGFTGSGQSNGHTGTASIGNYHVLYISYWAKYSDNWYGHESGINKQVYVWVGSAYTPFVMEAEGTGTGPLTPRIGLQRMIIGDGWYTANLDPSATFIRGSWFHVEIVLTGNSAGTADGSMDLYLNGAHITSASGLQWSTDATQWGVFEIYPVWGGVGTITVPATMTFDWDHVYLSGKN